MKSVTLAVAVLLAASVSAQEPVHKVGDEGVQAPKVTFEVKPAYTAEAMRAKIQGKVEMQTVVGTDGSPGGITVTQSLDTEHGLDAKAVDALKRWRFEPGRKDGKPVPVQVNVTMTFTLKDQK